MQCPYSGCLLKCSSKAVHRGKYAGISMRWKKRVLKLGEEVSEVNGVNGVSEQREPKEGREPIRSKLIDYDKLRELRILWPLDTYRLSSD